MMTAEELSELDNLLASLPEEFEPMDAAGLDGFLCEIALSPRKPSQAQWMPFVMDSAGRSPACPQADRIRTLASARYRDLNGCLDSGTPIDPVIFELEDGAGNPIQGPESAKALEPFACGFLDAMQRWPGLSDTDKPGVMSALIGILRHLPRDQQGDLKEIIEGLDRDSPIGDLDEALSDVVSCVDELAAQRPKKRAGTHHRR